MDFSEPWSDTISKVGYAVRIGNLKLLEEFLLFKQAVDIADNRGWRPLHEAAVGSSIECLDKLLKHKDTNINWTTHEGETALLLSCKRQASKAAPFVKLLLQHGADPNINDNEEDTPLLEALRTENKEVVDLLLNFGANVNDTDCSRWSPLHEAAKKKDPFFLQYLLNKGANIQMRDECGMTPIFTAAQHGSEKCLEILLRTAQERGQENVVDIGAEDWATPFMIAAQQGFVNCMKILLDFGADPNLMTSDKATALHLAIQGDNIECLQIILEKMNVEPLIRTFHPNSYEDTSMICPLHLAVEWGSHISLKTLLDAGFSPDSLNSYRENILNRRIVNLPKLESPLSLAAFKRDYTSIAILLSAGASCNPISKQAFHPVIRAMRTHQTEIFQLLLENGADLNYQRHSGGSNEVFLTSMIIGAKYVYLVLYYGCDPNLCFQSESEVFNFLQCADTLTVLRKFSLRLQLSLLLRFLVSSRRKAHHVYSRLSEKEQLEESDQINDLLEELWQPPSMKLLCIMSIRKHLYSIHATKLPKVIKYLKLPPSLENEVSCQDILEASSSESQFSTPSN